MRVNPSQGTWSNCSQILVCEPQKKVPDVSNNAQVSPVPLDRMRCSAATNPQISDGTHHAFWCFFSLGPGPPKKKCQAETYRDSKLFGGAADFSGRRDCPGDMPDGKSCWPDFHRQLNDDVSLRSSEGPAVAWGDTGLQRESQ